MRFCPLSARPFIYFNFFLMQSLSLFLRNILPSIIWKFDCHFVSLHFDGWRSNGSFFFLIKLDRRCVVFLFFGELRWEVIHLMELLCRPALCFRPARSSGATCPRPGSHPRPIWSPPSHRTTLTSAYKSSRPPSSSFKVRRTFPFSFLLFFYFKPLVFFISRLPDRQI